MKITMRICLIIYFSQLNIAGYAMNEDEAHAYINKEESDEMKRRLSKYGEDYGEDWMLIPDGDGVPQVAILKKKGRFLGFDFGSEGRDDSSDTGPDPDVIFKLYTRKNPEEGQPISPVTPDTIQASHFDPNKPTKFIVHGWKSSGESSTVLNIKDAYLQRSDVNVIGVDWSSISSNNYYPTPMSETRNVGNHVGRMIDTLVDKQGARHSDMHVIGHSLGAHVSGYAGSSSRHKISRITGLDPALPGFQYYQGPDGRLDETDAEFVEVIHTCSGALGMSAPAGHADFYPNGGSPFQPGCCCLPEFTQSCSHGRAHIYFAESIVNPRSFKAAPCETWNNFKDGTCLQDFVYMGEETPTNSRGIFYLITNSSAPYGMGESGSRYSE